MVHAVALLLIASAADVVRLETASDVAALCAELPKTERQSIQYEAVIPANALVLADPDASGPLLLEHGAALVGANGAADLYQMLDRRLPTWVDAAAQRDILAAKRAGTLTLTVLFEVPEEMRCSQPGGATPRTVPIIPVEWTYRDRETVLARGEAAPLPPIRGTPRVYVEAPLRGPESASAAVAARTAELRACYARVLSRYPDVRGFLTVSVGRTKPMVAVYGVANAPLANCVSRALAGVALRGDAMVRVVFALD